MDTSFERVWNRVKGASSENDSAILYGFIRDEQRDAADYACLACRTCAPNVRKLLMNLSEEERRHAKKLQAAAYMLFGEKTESCEPRYTAHERMLHALRGMHSRETEGAEAYSTAAESTSRESLKTLYRELSTEEQKHAEALCALLENLL